MKDQASLLRADPTDWLLGEDNPTVRYLTLRDLLGRSEGDPEVMVAKGRIMESGVVPKVLAKQNPGGHWGEPKDFYARSKYKGTVWNIILLAELHANPADRRVRDACEFVLNWSQHRSSGGFSDRGSLEEGGDDGVMSCLTGNMVFSLTRLGLLDDALVAKGLDWLVRYMRYETVSQAPKRWPYVSDRCWRDHTCRSGVVKALKAFSEVPADRRTSSMQKGIDEAVEFLLAQRILFRPPKLQEISRKEWLRFGFPLMWNTDLVEILGLLGRLGVRDERMDEAVGIVLSKQDEKGRWKQENCFKGRFITAVETNGKDSKWVTLNALRALRSISR